MTLGKTIRIARTMKDWSQRKLGAKAGLSLATVSSIETGMRSASVKSLNKIAEALDIPAFVLLFMALDEATRDSFGLDLKHGMLAIFYRETLGQMFSDLTGKQEKK